jgi:hypothetical protein
VTASAFLFGKHEYAGGINAHVRLAIGIFEHRFD